MGKLSEIIQIFSENLKVLWGIVFVGLAPKHYNYNTDNKFNKND